MLLNSENVSSLAPTTCRHADAGPVPAPRRVTRKALPTPESQDGFLRLAAVWSGEEVRNPTVPIHAGKSGAGHGAQPIRDTGTRAYAQTHTCAHLKAAGAQGGWHGKVF